MDIYTATEEAYKKGYEAGKRDAVIHATWEYYRQPSGTHGLRCTNCKERNGLKKPFCPHCGAQMDKGE